MQGNVVNTPIRILLILVLSAFLVPVTALAHGGAANEAQTFVQTLGEHEVHVTIQPVRRVPGPLLLEVRFGGVTPAGVLFLQATPASEWPTDAHEAQVQAVAGDRGPYYVQLQVDRPGAWNLILLLESSTGSEAVLPFTVAMPLIAPQEVALNGSFFALALCLFAAGALAAVARQRPVAVWPFGLIAAGALVSVTVGLTLAVQQSLTPPPAPHLARPHVNMALRSTPAVVRAGQPVNLELLLSDGASGQPVDDLVAHHAALLHLVVISADGEYFAHLHPARLGAGRYQIRLTPDRPGLYTAYAEIERSASGTQVIARPFSVSGTPVESTTTPIGIGIRQIGDLAIEVTSTRTPLRSGEPATLRLNISRNGLPVSDIEPWLGMAGHLIVRSGDEAIFGHVHAIGPMNSGNNTRYGPEIAFAYTFPQAGAYRLWAQFQYAGQVITVPMQLSVEP